MLGTKLGSSLGTFLGKELPGSSKYYRYYGPDVLTDAFGVYEWPDSGDAPLSSMTTDSTALQPASGPSTVMEPLTAVFHSTNVFKYLYSDFSENGNDSFSFAVAACQSSMNREGWAFSVSGDINTFLVLSYDGNADEDSGWYLDDVLLGNSGYIIIAVTALSDGTWSASYKLNGGSTQTATGTFVFDDPTTYMMISGISSSESSGNIQTGEARTWSHKALTSAERLTKIAELMTIWQP